jgi:hypothetical protein
MDQVIRRHGHVSDGHEIQVLIAAFVGIETQDFRFDEKGYLPVVLQVAEYKAERYLVIGFLNVFQDPVVQGSKKLGFFKGTGIEDTGMILPLARENNPAAFQSRLVNDILTEGDCFLPVPFIDFSQGILCDIHFPFPPLNRDR